MTIAQLIEHIEKMQVWEFIIAFAAFNLLIGFLSKAIKDLYEFSFKMVFRAWQVKFDDDVSKRFSHKRPDPETGRPGTRKVNKNV